ncbi:hypothetical protein BN1221_04683 [Brenneria goodwinii]|uniref:Uncharacterized protein n=1 Tax=Brenneria goodwinii TaxID=1109412 RepID=A0A0G4K2N2_9GAMM|nr:hypothetical protein BN1221_04683 [Brenneria goodwinii]
MDWSPPMAPSRLRYEKLKIPFSMPIPCHNARYLFAEMI